MTSLSGNTATEQKVKCHSEWRDSQSRSVCQMCSDFNTNYLRGDSSQLLNTWATKWLPFWWGSLGVLWMFTYLSFQFTPTMPSYVFHMYSMWMFSPELMLGLRQQPRNKHLVWWRLIHSTRLFVIPLRWLDAVEFGHLKVQIKTKKELCPKSHPTALPCSWHQPLQVPQTKWVLGEQVLSCCVQLVLKYFSTFYPCRFLYKRIMQCFRETVDMNTIVLSGLHHSLQLTAAVKHLYCIWNWLINMHENTWLTSELRIGRLERK